MIVTLLPRGLRTQFEMTAMEGEYHDRLLQLSGNEVEAEKLHNSFNRQLKPVFHKWSAYNKIALEESTRTLSPSEKRMVSAVVEFSKK